MTYELLENLCKNKTFPLCGKNPDGCNIIIEKGEDFFTVSTLQKNGWTRINTYWKDGTVEEEYGR